jgi:hypothetical protein
LGFSSVEDAQKAWTSAIDDGAKVTMPFAPQEWGNHYGILIDPFGVSWYVSSYFITCWLVLTHIERAISARTPIIGGIGEPKNKKQKE